MKTIPLWTRPLGAFVAAVCHVAWLAGAQPAAERPERRADPPRDRPRAERPAAEAPRPGPALREILTPEQREQFREHMEASRERARDLEERMETHHREMHELMFAGQPNEEAIRKHAAALAELQAERVLLQARVFSKLRPALTPEQLERLRTMRPGPGRERGPRADAAPSERPPQEARPAEPERRREEARLRERERFHQPAPEDPRPPWRGEFGPPPGVRPPGPGPLPPLARRFGPPPPRAGGDFERPLPPRLETRRELFRQGPPPDRPPGLRRREPGFERERPELPPRREPERRREGRPPPEGEGTAPPPPPEPR